MRKVKAYIRIRPLTGEERRREKKKSWCKIGDKGIVQTINTENQEISSTAMYFDGVFEENERNEDVFIRIEEEIEKVLKKENVCVIAYGQTSSGKTHTMRGSFSTHGKIKRVKEEEDPGIIPRAMALLFKKREKETLSVSFIQLYNECVYDLLGSSEEQLQIRELSSGLTYIKDAKEIEVETEEDAMSLFIKGDQRRKISSTKMNRESSRSHALFKITVKKEGNTSWATFVDLAGSERSKQTLSKGVTLKEGAYINKSLLALTTVISKLSIKHAHIPFRDAKLTRILQPSLTEGSTILISTISPLSQYIEESLSTLLLATRAKNIEIKPTPKPQVSQRSHLLNSLTTFKKEVKSDIQVISENIKNTKILFSQVETEISSLLQQHSNYQNDLVLIKNQLKSSSSQQIDRLNNLSISMNHLLKQEKQISSFVSPSSLLMQLVEGDKLIQKQKKEIDILRKKKETEFNQNTIDLAIELDKLKKEFLREKRVLQLKISQLETENQKAQK
ncbi:hypothetical protein NEFER03_1648 [Nematocida sp. LUAm3]|nr:hypothetical protein NEFER03_1648 [Nematocida sp. LUAm3]KAI5174672.1 hypothetical protein NEFER02_0782 [Nematocida sp. LUAm2]KAI5177918.1 hypothetical protein NEFER01_1120 [Nematocida sp. LUAm1]